MLEKVEVWNADKNERVGACMFNPKEITIERQNDWKAGNASGVNVPPIEFGSGKPQTMTVQLFFDTYHKAKGEDKADDVRGETDRILALMDVDESLKGDKSHKARPPKVRLHWGEFKTVDLVIMSVRQQFTLFAQSGKPLRATLDLSLQQVKDIKDQPKQNPTSGGPGGERVWTVKQGETLQWIAYREFGDPTRWRPIADANRLGEVRRLTPGQVLVIPTL